jgi:hypothetical protein
LKKLSMWLLALVLVLATCWAMALAAFTRSMRKDAESHRARLLSEAAYPAGVKRKLLVIALLVVLAPACLYGVLLLVVGHLFRQEVEL